LLLLKPDPDFDNARYILSTIPETIGTVFVITIAIMQMLGHLKLKEFVMRPEFILSSLVTFLSIVSALMILYLNIFKIGTAICIGWSVGNLIVIGWFILRVATAQDIAGWLGQKEIPYEIEKGKSILDLRKEALDALDHNVPSTAQETIGILTQRALKLVPESNSNSGEGKACDICRVLADIVVYDNNRSYETWMSAIQSLIKLDRTANDKGMSKFSQTCSLMSLRKIYQKTLGTFSRFASSGTNHIRKVIWDYFKLTRAKIS
jgi:hypothetical protein